MVRGEPQHGGFSEAALKKPFHLEWAVEFEAERLGAAMEPIVAEGKVFVATHTGNLYALDAATGAGLWRFAARGPFLHSPAVAEGRVIAASVDGRIYALNAERGRLEWTLSGRRGGFSAAPIIVDKKIYIGSRGGSFLAVDLVSGKELWRHELGAPIRQTAAHSDGKVVVTGEDLRVRCFAADDGALLWTSRQLPGQTARDYYPVIVKQEDRTFIVVRTNPLLNMGQRIGRDRTMLCRNAGVDDSSWKTVDAWMKSDEARGSAELWEKEQLAIISNLQANPDAQSFFVLDAETGGEAHIAPVLWVAGCQAVGVQPARTRNGRLLVFYRSAYGNWNHGVAPLVALGLLDLAANRITPLFHRHGKQPPWNTFWGTADESQNFLVAGNTVLIVHQGTLSGFDLKTNELFTLHGERDTYGGFRNPAWARNEWHGPGRGGVALSKGRIFWQTGSRVLCLAPGAETGKPKLQTVVTKSLPAEDSAPALEAPALPRQLAAAVEELLSKRWAPLFTDPGLSGRVFSFDRSGDFIEALSWALPHLPAALQERVKSALSEEWKTHMPFSASGAYPLNEGAPRELFPLPAEYRTRLGSDKAPHRFGDVRVARLFADRCGAAELVQASWPAIREAYLDFTRTGWRLDPAKGDAHANRYLASFLAVESMARAAGDESLAAEAREQAVKTGDALIAWWERAAQLGGLRSFKGSAELDPYIGAGGGVSFAVAPHRHQLALFQDLTPEVAQLIRSRAPAAVDALWEEFETLYRTWWVIGEERQVHSGENFIDPPELALSGFRAAAWLRATDAEQLSASVELPFCRADLSFIMKTAVALEARPPETP